MDFWDVYGWIAIDNIYRSEVSLMQPRLPGLGIQNPTNRWVRPVVQVNTDGTVRQSLIPIPNPKNASYWRQRRAFKAGQCAMPKAEQRRRMLRRRIRRAAQNRGR